MNNNTNTNSLVKSLMAGIVFGKSEIGIDNLFIEKKVTEKKNQETKNS